MGIELPKPAPSFMVLPKGGSVLSSYRTDETDLRVEDIQVYRCDGEMGLARCPGGKTNNGFAHRMLASHPACGRCDASGIEIYTRQRDNDTCRKCEFLDMIAGWVVITISIFGFAFLFYYAFNSSFRWRLSTKEAIGLLGEVSFELCQVCGVATSGVDFPQSVALLSHVYSLDFDMAMFFDITCFGGSLTFSTNPIGEYVPQTLFIPLLAFSPFLFMLLSRRFRNPWELYETQNTVAKIYSTLFVSQVALSLWPIECYTNPGDSAMSVRVVPSVLCIWDDYIWTIMLIAGVSSLIFCMTFVSFLIWEVHRLPRMMSNPETQKYYSRARQFLFEDFSMEAYYWILPMKFREVTLGLLPSIIVDQKSLRITVVSSFILVTAFSTAWVQPMRVRMANFLEISILALLTTGMICAISMQEPAVGLESDNLSGMFSVVLVIPPLMMFSVIAGSIYSVIRRGCDAELPPIMRFRRVQLNNDAIREAWMELCSSDEVVHVAMFDEAVESFQFYDMERLERILSLFTDVQGLPRNQMAKVAAASTRESMGIRVSRIRTTIRDCHGTVMIPESSNNSIDHMHDWASGDEEREEANDTDSQSPAFCESQYEAVYSM